MMRYGIPAYRLPRDVLDAEINRVIDLGIDVECNHTVHDVDQERREGGFDAVYLGVGAQLAKRVAIPSGIFPGSSTRSPTCTRSPTTRRPSSDAAS